MCEDFDEDFCNCPRCSGYGEIDCHCGGDICVCENYGKATCPLCHGECEVSETRYHRYFEIQRENARIFAEAASRIPANAGFADHDNHAKIGEWGELVDWGNQDCDKFEI